MQMDLLNYAMYLGRKRYGNFDIDTISIKIDRLLSITREFDADNSILILTKAPTHVGTEIYSDYTDVYKIADTYDALNNDFQIKQFFGTVKLTISDTLGDDVQIFQFIRIIPEKDTETLTN